MSFGERGRRNIVPTDIKEIAGDHGFKTVSLTPSVILRVDVKPREGENGTLYYRVEVPS